MVSGSFSGSTVSGTDPRGLLLAGLLALQVLLRQEVLERSQRLLEAQPELCPFVVPALGSGVRSCGSGLGLEVRNCGLGLGLGVWACGQVLGLEVRDCGLEAGCWVWGPERLLEAQPELRPFVVPGIAFIRLRASSCFTVSPA